MRIAVMGGGPGLYFATLWKARHPKDDVQVFEQNPADATFGFGVVTHQERSTSDVRSEVYLPRDPCLFKKAKGRRWNDA